jgi:trimethylamine--corrinoid protein Co-methyltransferase
MLDYVLTFSLPKLIFDDELCGQALHFVREMTILEDLPVVDLVRELMNEQHLITAEHTMKYWPEQLYLPHPVIDRLNRENWTRAGEKRLLERAMAAVEERLAAYRPVGTDPHLVEELQKIIRAGMKDERPLPEIPEANGAMASAGGADGRRRQRRRGR